MPSRHSGDQVHKVDFSPHCTKRGRSGKERVPDGGRRRKHTRAPAEAVPEPCLGRAVAAGAAVVGEHRLLKLDLALRKQPAVVRLDLAHAKRVEGRVQLGDGRLDVVERREQWGKKSTLCT